jgi:predicted deacylase
MIVKTPKQVRSYDDVVARLKKISRAQKLRLEHIGETSGYDVFSLATTHRPPKPTDIYLSAGTHGDEPAGVEALLRWLEEGEWARVPHNVYALPCINPWGFERNTRENEFGLDINRQFRRDGCVECEIVKRALHDRCFTRAVELHEDIDSPGFYLYEIKSHPPYFGEEVVAAVEAVGPINRARIIEEMPSRGGVIRRPRTMVRLMRRRLWPLAFRLYTYHARHALTLETPGPKDFELRVAMHLAALRAATK